MWVGFRQHWSWLYCVDWSLLNGAHDIAIRHPMWVRCWDGVSFVLGPTPLRLVGTLAVVAALVRRNVRVALVLLACAPLNGFVTTAAKSLANRPRPSTMLVAAPSTSFPSGHALEATATFLALLTFLLPMLSRSMRDRQGSFERALPVRRAGRLVAGILVFPAVPVGVSAA
jgi:membrane-associated phospholipid phosphatase